MKIDYSKLRKDFMSDFQRQTLKAARWGILGFCLLHFFFEIAMGNDKGMLLAVMFNYFISEWYVKKQIKNDKFTENPVLSGMLVAFVVFLIRLLLGLLITYLK
jgi:hypothetical protein